MVGIYTILIALFLPVGMGKDWKQVAERATTAQMLGIQLGYLSDYIEEAEKELGIKGSKEEPTLAKLILLASKVLNKGNLPVEPEVQKEETPVMSPEVLKTDTSLEIEFKPVEEAPEEAAPIMEEAPAEPETVETKVSSKKKKLRQSLDAVCKSMG